MVSEATAGPAHCRHSTAAPIRTATTFSRARCASGWRRSSAPQRLRVVARRAAISTSARQAQLNTCRNEAYLDAVSSNPMAAFDMGRAAAAFAEFERLASMCDPGIVQWAISPTGLRGIVNGTRNANDSCLPPPTQSMDKAVVAAHLASCKRQRSPGVSSASGSCPGSVGRAARSERTASRISTASMGSSATTRTWKLRVPSASSASPRTPPA